MRFMRLMLAVQLLSGVAVAEGQMYRAGMYDQQADALLAQAVMLVTLRKTEIEEVAPQYSLPNEDRLEWTQALLEADKRFSNQPVKRALYLWKQLPVDADADCLSKLGLAEIGSSMSSGSCRSMGFVLDPVSAPPFVQEDEIKAALIFTVTHRVPSRVLSQSTLGIRETAIDGFSFKALSFDVAGKLVGFSAYRALPDGAGLTIGGNTSGTDDTNFYFATVAIDRKVRESINYSSDLVITSRMVEDPESDARYREIYKDGKLVRRNHYGTIRVEGGTQSVITKTETFDSATLVRAENKTDASLKWKDGATQESEISSETGDLYNKVAHHGPAVENEWMGIRIYFDKKCVFDAYNKTRPGLELAAADWYPTEEQQKEGWGADQYKVGPTVGLGGVRLWDGEKVVWLDPVKKRTARAKKEACYSQIEMLSEGVPYKGGTVDVLVRVTAFSGMREMKVEAFALCDQPVQFVTGINYWPMAPSFEGEGCMGSWGIHPEDVAAFQMNIGGGLVYNPADFAEKKKTDGEILLISKPAKTITTWITSACEKESGFESGDDFEHYVKQISL